MTVTSIVSVCTGVGNDVQSLMTNAGAVVSIVNEVIVNGALALVAASVTVIVQAAYVPSSNALKVI